MSTSLVTSELIIPHFFFEEKENCTVCTIAIDEQEAFNHLNHTLHKKCMLAWKNAKVRMQEEWNQLHDQDIALSEISCPQCLVLIPIQTINQNCVEQGEARVDEVEPANLAPEGGGEFIAVPINEIGGEEVRINPRRIDRYNCLFSVIGIPIVSLLYIIAVDEYSKDEKGLSALYFSLAAGSTLANIYFCKHIYR